MSKYLCIDIGGTQIKVALIDGNGHINVHRTVKTPQNKPAFLQLLDSLVKEFYEHIAGIAISVPGKVDRATQTLYFGGSLPFLNQINFSEILSKYGLPVYVENDGKAAALAEIWRGNLKGVNNGAMIVLGTAVGGGIVINGNLLYGDHSQAGEFSFMMNGSSKSGDQKMVAHNASAVEMVKAMNAATHNPDLSDGYEAFKAASHGNAAALQALRQSSYHIAQLILNIQTIIDGTHFVIGGGVSAQPLLIQSINKAYDELIEDPQIIKQTLNRPEILPAVYRSDANLIGALYGLTTIEKNQERANEKQTIF